MSEDAKYVDKGIDELAATVASRPLPDADETCKALATDPFTKKGDTAAASAGPVHHNKLLFAPVNAKNMGQLRVLNHMCFPLVYGETFYSQVLNPDNVPVSFYACDGGDVPVGAICCRFEENGTRIYIMTLSVLSAYRRLGIGAALIEELLRRLKESHKNVKEITLHVHTPNDGAVAFYEKLGFTVVETVSDYYKNLQPASAFFLRKQL